METQKMSSEYHYRARVYMFIIYYVKDIFIKIWNKSYLGRSYNNTISSKGKLFHVSWLDSEYLSHDSSSTRMRWSSSRWKTNTPSIHTALGRVCSWNCSDRIAPCSSTSTWPIGTSGVKRGVPRRLTCATTLLPRWSERLQTFASCSNTTMSGIIYAWMANSFMIPATPITKVLWKTVRDEISAEIVSARRQSGAAKVWRNLTIIIGSWLLKTLLNISAYLLRMSRLRMRNSGRKEILGEGRRVTRLARFLEWSAGTLRAFWWYEVGSVCEVGGGVSFEKRDLGDEIALHRESKWLSTRSNSRPYFTLKPTIN